MPSWPWPTRVSGIHQAPWPASDLTTASLQLNSGVGSRNLDVSSQLHCLYQLPAHFKDRSSVCIAGLPMNLDQVVRQRPTPCWQLYSSTGVSCGFCRNHIGTLANDKSQQAASPQTRVLVARSQHSSFCPPMLFQPAYHQMLWFGMSL